MTCPPEIASILLNILTWGLLSIRNNANDPVRCLVESDHLHNLPELVRDFSHARLAYYWKAERPCFIKKPSGMDLVIFESFWEELRPYVESSEGREPAGYLVVVEPDGHRGFGAFVPDLPGSVSGGESVEEALTQIREAMLWHVDSLRRHNDPVPAPSAIGQTVMIDQP